MAYFMAQVAYTSEAWARMVKDPVSPMDMPDGTVIPIIRRVLGNVETVVGRWVSFGEYDAVTIFQAPDNVGAGAISMALSASGNFKVVRTTVLMTVEEGRSALKRASQAGPGD